jgi:hypothetical protein
VIDKPIVGENAECEVYEVEKELPVVVGSNAVEDPRAMTGLLSVKPSPSMSQGGRSDLLVMLGHATVTPAAMLTPEGRPDHACHAEVSLVKFP